MRVWLETAAGISAAEDIQVKDGELPTVVYTGGDTGRSGQVFSPSPLHIGHQILRVY